MLFRTLVGNYVRQAAEQKLHQAAARKQAGEVPEGDESTPPVEIPPCDVAFIFALGVESGGLVDIMPGRVTTRCPSFLEHSARLEGKQVIVADGGVGAEAAAKATEDLIVIHKPAWVVSAGFAGGLQDPLRRGHILMADTVCDTEGNELSVGLKLDPRVVEATKGLHVGRLVTVDHIIREEKEKRELGEKYDAMACDMETMAVAQVCQRNKVRFLSVRIISDAVDDRLPVEVEQLIAQKTLSAKIGAVTGAIFKRISSLKDMWKLKEQALKLSDRLAKFLIGVIPQLTVQERDESD